MKFSISLALLTVSAVQGFAPAAFNTARLSATSLNERADATEAIKAAMKASKEFGSTSVEARMAWETVEEIDAADTSPATAKGLDEECSVEEAASKACQEYGENLDKLTALMKENAPFIKQMTDATNELKRIKVATAPITAGKDSPELRAAVEEAKKASKENGATSPEARVAWDVVEEIAAAGNAPAMGGMLESDECLVESMEACEALDALNKSLKL